MKLVLFSSLVIFVSILPKYSQQTFWRRPKPTLPSDPNAPIYQKLQQIPSPKKTAQMILDNFVRYHPGQNGKRANLEEDTVLVMDGSGSIGSCEFGEGKKAMSYLMETCNEKGASCRFAGVTFASYATRNFNYLSIAQASRKMSAVSFPDGGTNTKEGLEEAERIIRAGVRRWARNMIFLVTDGRSNDRQATLDSAKRIKNSMPSLEIFVVAVGNHVNGVDEMAQVASYPPLDHVYRVEQVSDLKYVFELALKEMNPNKYRAVKPTRLCN